MRSLSEAVRSFNDAQKQKESIDLLYASISPLTDAYLSVTNTETQTHLSKRNLHEVYTLIN